MNSPAGVGFVLAFSAIAWLLVLRLFTMLAGVKVHASGMMAGSAWMSYGRIVPAADLALQFGFLVQLGPGVSAWVWSPGQTVLVDGGYLYIGGIIWNTGDAWFVGNFWLRQRSRRFGQARCSISPVCAHRQRFKQTTADRHGDEPGAVVYFCRDTLAAVVAGCWVPVDSLFRCRA